MYHYSGLSQQHFFSPLLPVVATRCCSASLQLADPPSIALVVCSTGSITTPIAIPHSRLSLIHVRYLMARWLAGWLVLPGGRRFSVETKSRETKVESEHAKWNDDDGRQATTAAAAAETNRIKRNVLLFSAAFRVQINPFL